MRWDLPGFSSGSSRAHRMRSMVRKWHTFEYIFDAVPLLQSLRFACLSALYKFYSPLAPRRSSVGSVCLVFVFLFCCCCGLDMWYDGRIRRLLPEAPDFRDTWGSCPAAAGFRWDPVARAIARLWPSKFNFVCLQNVRCIQRFVQFGTLLFAS